MSSEAAWALAGAVVGGLLSAATGWLVAIALDRRRERQRLHAAIGLVAPELQDNIARIGQSGAVRFTYGDWHSNKRDLTALHRRDPQLWEDLVATYGRIFDAANGGPPLDAERLEDVRRRLLAEQKKLESG
jgi:hypothetical protein